MHLTLFVSVLLFGTCFAQTNPVWPFLEGFAEGLEIEIGNPQTCAKDVNITLEDFESGYALIKQGIHDWSVSKVEAGLKDWAAGVYMCSTVLKDCGAATLAADIERLAAQLASGAGGILKLLAEEIINIIDHDIYHLFRDAIAAYEQQQWEAAGKFTGQIVGILLSVE